MSFVLGLVIGCIIGVSAVLVATKLTRQPDAKHLPARPAAAPDRLYRTKPHPNMDGEPSRVRRALYRQRRYNGE